MAEEGPTSSSGNPWQNPQVLIALITGIVSILVAVIGLLPTLIAANTPTPTPTFTHTLMPTSTFTATFTMTFAALSSATEMIIIPPTTIAAPFVPDASETPVNLLVSASTSANNPVPATTSTPEPLTVDQPDPNVILLYDNVSFTLVNRSGRVLSLEDVKFRSDSGKWDARDWGPSLYDRLPDDNCLRLRDAASGPRNPPGECGNLFGLIMAGNEALFWLNTPEFSVQLKKEVLATCKTDTGRCDVYIPQS